MKEILKSYVSRHVRLGCSIEELPTLEVLHDSVEAIPILDDDGNLVKIFNRRVSSSALDMLAKYKPEDFKLRNLLDAGVNLSVVNLVESNSHMLDILGSIVNDADSALSVVDRLKSIEDEKQHVLDNFVNEPSKSTES